MLRKTADNVSYVFYTAHAKYGKIRVKCSYWERIFKREEAGWISEDGLWRPLPGLEMELENIYQKKVKGIP